MFNKLTYKKRCYLVGVGFVFLCFVAYKLAFVETILLKNELEDKRQQLELSKNAHIEMARINQELEWLSSQLISTSTEEDFQNKVIAGISGYCRQNNLEVVEVRESWLQEQNGYRFELCPVVVKGGYVDIVRTIYSMEQKDRSFKIEGVQFLKKKNIRYRQEYLTACIYFQNIKAV